MSIKISNDNRNIYENITIHRVVHKKYTVPQIFITYLVTVSVSKWTIDILQGSVATYVVTLQYC